ncbi:MAG: hypothetical protein WBA12_09820, partial [Catalinimonas sp.]
MPTLLPLRLPVLLPLAVLCACGGGDERPPGPPRLFYVGADRTGPTPDDAVLDALRAELAADSVLIEVFYLDAARGDSVAVAARAFEAHG